MFAVAFSLVLLVSMLGEMQFIRVGMANPYEYSIWTSPPELKINSPMSDEIFSINNQTSAINILLNFTATKPTNWLIGWNDSTGFYKNEFVSFNITLNGNFVHSIDITSDSDLSSPFNYSETFTGLVSGSYNLTIFTHSIGWNLEGHGFWHTKIPVDTPFSIIFTVRTDDTAPTISSMSIQSKTYAKKDLLLSFLTSEVSENWYCLDGQSNITISRNVTLTGLTDGIHTLIVYANDTVGNVGHSDLVQFTIDTSTPAPTLVPTLEPTITPHPHGTMPTGFLGTNIPTEYGYAIVAILVIIIVAGLSLVYLKKLRK